MSFDAVLVEVLAQSGKALPVLRGWVGEHPADGVARALLVCVTSNLLSDHDLREQMRQAHRDAGRRGARDASRVYALYLAAHRQHRATAGHLVLHLTQHPADPVAVLLMSCFTSTGQSHYRDHGWELAGQQYALAGKESWAWAGWLAAVRAEQNRPEEAHRLALHALDLYPRAGTAAHARAHAEHAMGHGDAYVTFIDSWLAEDPHAIQRAHLQWHAALQSLAAGHLDDARHRADTELAHTDVGMRSAVNWRLLLAGRTPARLVEAAHAHALLAEARGWAEVFHTFQLALALAATGDTPGLEAMSSRALCDPRPEYSQVLSPVAAALAHLTAGRPGPAVDLLTALGDETERLGGVRVEREIIQDTLARALTDAGHPERAAHLLHHRITTRRHHIYEDLLLT